MACIDVVTLHSKGRCAVASRELGAGHLVLACDPLAAVLDEGSEMFSESSLKRFKVSRQEQEVMRRGCDRSALLCRRVLNAIEHADAATLAEVDVLCDNLALRTPSELEMYRAVAQYICWSLPSDSRFKTDESAVVRLLSALACNAFSICDFEFREQGIGFYPSAAVLNHSCEPNCVAVFDQAQLQIRSVRRVATGEELTISYTEQARPTWVRRAALWSSYKFHCMCARCCVAEPASDVPCFNPACNGALEPSKFHVIQFHEHQVMDSSRAEQILPVFELPLPQWIATVRTIRDNESRLEGLRCTHCGVTSTKLKQCLQDLQACDALYKEAKLQMQNIQEQETAVRNLKRCLRLAKVWLRPNGFAMLEVLGTLAMAFTNMHDFGRAARCAEAALPCFYACYPHSHRHPVVAVQQLFVAKLLDNVSTTSSAEEAQVGHRILQLLAAALPVLQSTQPMHAAQIAQAQALFGHWRSRFPQYGIGPPMR